MRSRSRLSAGGAGLDAPAAPATLERGAATAFPFERRVFLAEASPPVLLVVGGGLFGSMAARFARSRGVDTLVFDPGLEGAASPAAAGLFKPEWFGQKFRQHFEYAVPWLDQVVGIR